MSTVVALYGVVAVAEYAQRVLVTGNLTWELVPLLQDLMTFPFLSFDIASQYLILAYRALRGLLIQL